MLVWLNTKWLKSASRSRSSIFCYCYFLMATKYLFSPQIPYSSVCTFNGNQLSFQFVCRHFHLCMKKRKCDLQEKKVHDMNKFFPPNEYNSNDVSTHEISEMKEKKLLFLCCCWIIIRILTVLKVEEGRQQISSGEKLYVWFVKMERKLENVIAARNKNQLIKVYCNKQSNSQHPIRLKK